MSRLWSTTAIAALTLSVAAASGQQGAADASAGAEQSATNGLQEGLDAFRKGLFTAFNEGKYQEMLEKHVLPDAIAVWEDGNLTKGHAEILAEFDKLSKIITKIQVDPTIDHRLVFDNGKTVISAGKLRDTYLLKGGQQVALDSVFTVTLVKQEGKWMLASFNGVADAFDNQVIDLSMQQQRIWSAGIGLLVGLAVGGFIAYFLSRPSGAGKAAV